MIETVKNAIQKNCVTERQIQTVLNITCFNIKKNI